MSGKHWTETEQDQAHTVLIPYLEALKSEYRDTRLTWFECFLGMYADMQDISLLPSRSSAPASPLLNRYAVPINVVAPLVDTAEARITQARPRPFFKTVGGSWSQQRQAKKLQKFADGIFDETKAYRLGAQALKDAALLGTGCVKVFTKNGKICAERVLMSEILVNEVLGFDSKPPEIAQVKEVSRDALKKQVDKKHWPAIDALVSVASRSSSFYTDMVEVFEAWYLAKGDPDDKENYIPGRHVIVVSGATLLDEPWKHDYFPLIFIRWREAPTGFHGLGIAQQVMSTQIEITSTVKNISKNHHLNANPRVLVQNGSGINPNHITNAWGTVLEYSGGLKPEMWVPQIVSPECYQWFQMMYEKAFELVGLSTQSAFAQKPKGIDSAKGLRELSDIQSDRMAPVSQRYENFFLDLTRAFVDCAEHLAETDPSFAVVAPGKSHAERMSWKDVRMPKDDYTIQLFAANFLSRTPAGLFDDIQNLLNLQLIDPVTARKLLDFPDLQQVFDQENAARDNFESQIEKILDDALLLPPQPFDDLALGIKTYRDAYNRARLDEVPEDRLELLRTWIEQAQALVPKPPQPAPAPMGAPMPA
jgi:hypothetical protein